jgi:DNA polymerase-3 subunit delta'
MSEDPPAAEPDRLEGAPHPRETEVLFGQDEAQAQFLSSLEAGRLPHGWMITGPQGVGKATLAWRMARHLISGGAGGSLQMDSSDPVFRKAAALSEPQLFLCRRARDAKTKRLKTAIGVDEVRALKAFFQMSATEGGWRVAIVDAADEMTVPAENALLKILEEPPERSVLLLVCHQPSKLLPTLRSRCRVLRCRPLAPASLALALDAAGVATDNIDADALAVLAAGSAGAAHRLIEAGGLEIYAGILDLLHSAPSQDRARALSLAGSCAGRGAEARYGLVLDLLQTALSRLALAGAGGQATPVSEVEAGAFARLAASPSQARLWATAAPHLAGRAAHARAVHLDPAQVIIDMFSQIDATAAKARALAA